MKEGSSRKDESSATCFHCGKSAHMKNDCPKCIKNTNTYQGKHKNGRKGRKAYISWEDEDKSSTSNGESKIDIANLCFMGHNS